MCQVLDLAFDASAESKTSLVNSAQLIALLSKQIANVREHFGGCSIPVHVKHYSFSILRRCKSVVSDVVSILVFKVYCIFLSPCKLLVVNILVAEFPVFKTHLVSVFVLNVLALKFSFDFLQTNSGLSDPAKVARFAKVLQTLRFKRLLLRSHALIL